MKHHCMVFALSVIAAVSWTTASAQVATGIPQYNSFSGGPFDIVNLGNLNVHLAIPIIHKPGRGIPFNYDLTYDSAIWKPVTVSGTTTWQPVFNWGWQSSYAGNIGYYTYSSTTIRCTDGGTGSYAVFSNFVYHDPWGINHRFPGFSQGSSSCSTAVNPFPSTANDGSQLVLKTLLGPILTPGGGSLAPPRNPPNGSTASSTTVTDGNGNQTTSNSSGVFTDTLGSPVLTVAGATPNPVTFTYTSPSGSSKQFAINYVQYTVKTSFGVKTNAGSNIGEYGPTSIALVDNITLPDQSKYSFTYETTAGCTPLSGTHQPSCVSGRLASVTLPSGGTITYLYNGGPANTGIYNEGSTAALTRILTPSTSCTSGGCWQYSRTLLSGSPGPGSTWQTTVVDPNSNSTVINFAEDGNTGGPTYGFLETQRLVYQGAISSSNLLMTGVECYNAAFANCATAGVSTPISQIDSYTQLPNGRTRLAETQLNGLSTGSGLPSSLKDYDYGVTIGSVPSTSHLVRETVLDWSALGNGILRPIIVTVKDWTSGLAVIKSTTTYTYDQGTPTSTPACPNTGCTPQHISITGARGNPTTVQYLTNLKRQYTYYDTGNINTGTDVNGAVTTYKYGACGNSFLTETDAPLGLTTFLNWDSNCAGGVVVTNKDVNGNPTTYSYTDPNFWRLTGVSYPDGGSTTVTYSEGTNSPWTIATTAAKDSVTTITSQSTLDGFGRTTQTRLTSDTSGTDIVNTTYDRLGRVQSVSNPYRTTSDETYGVTQFAYDAMGRLNSITDADTTGSTNYTYTGAAVQIQDEGLNTSGNNLTTIYQSDGLGRLTSVCNVSGTALLGSAGTPAACNLDISGSGFLTSYGYDVLGDLTSVSQPGVAPRQFSYDQLSRRTQEVNPESGTTTYVYDTSTPGDLYQRIRPQQNQTGSATVTTTYTTDALHRITAVSYSDGSTPGVTYSYDQASVNGISLANGKGRLTNAAVAGNTAGTILSYDTMGRIAEEWQCTPLNCGTTAFPLTFSYDYLGDLTKVINGFENVTYTYSYDSVGRFAKLQSSLIDASHPGTLVTVNSYNPLGEVQQATLGNGVVRTLHYDKRGRLTSLTDGSLYSFNIGYAPDTGVLTGNDSINGNWNYSYDALGRIATASKSGLALNYKYDPSGNRWQQNVTTGTAPAPQYSFGSNNQIQGAPPSCTSANTYCYDAAGNLLNDSFHQYAYDAEGRLLSVDATAATYKYDAFGRRVRSTTSSGALDFIFDLEGHSIDEVKGTAWDRGELYASGGHLGSYVNSTTYFEHSDWLGTVRGRSGIAGTSLAETCTSLPFGDNQSCVGSDLSPLHFASLQWDPQSNLQHAWLRQDSTTEGRWTSPDPDGLAATDSTDTDTWNKYAYALNAPNNGIDSSGTCTIFVGGVKDNKNNQAFQDAANSVGGVYVAPYDGKSAVSAILSIAAQSVLGPNASTQQVADMVDTWAKDPNGIQIVAYSGGAQAFSTAAQEGLLGSSGALDNITQITYLSPGLGPFGSLYTGQSTTSTSIYHGHGVTDFAATFFARLAGQRGNSLPCGHNFHCEFGALPNSIKNKLTPCPRGGGSNDRSGNAIEPTGGWVEEGSTAVWTGESWVDATVWFWLPSGGRPVPNAPPGK